MVKYVITYDKVLQLKTEVSKHFDDKVHFHDSCGGQYFSFDSKNSNLKDFIINYFLKQGIKVVFSDDELNFHLEK